MARKSPREKHDTLMKVTQAWESLRPRKTFYELTLRQFKGVIAPSLRARAEIERLQLKLRIAIKKRDVADHRSFEKMFGVVHAVLGDPEEGGNGELYRAMGYSPWSARHRPRRRKRPKGKAG
jgi:hypothetical protein